MFCQSSCGYYTPMSFEPGSCNPNGGMDEYYEDINPQWQMMERGPYGAVSNPYHAEYQPILTPASLPDTSYAATRTSPVLSHHSQEYQYPVSDSIGHHGLGITTPYPSELTGNANYGLGIAPGGYAIRDETFSPQPAKRQARRGSKQPTPREPPVTILPHPEGVQRLEEQRRQSYADPGSQRRAPGRGRKDSKQAEEEDDFVEQLRERKLAWRVVQDMFREKYKKDASEASLQMRQSRRRKDRMARWGEHDIQVLLRARQQYEQERYRVIAEKMTELGATTSFTAEQCEAQLENLDAQDRDRGRDREEPEQENNQQYSQHHESTDRRKRRRTEPEAEDPEELQFQQKKPKKKLKATESHFRLY